MTPSSRARSPSSSFSQKPASIRSARYRTRSCRVRWAGRSASDTMVYADTSSRWRNSALRLRAKSGWRESARSSPEPEAHGADRGQRQRSPLPRRDRTPPGIEFPPFLPESNSPQIPGADGAFCIKCELKRDESRGYSHGRSIHIRTSWQQHTPKPQICHLILATLWERISPLHGTMQL